MSKTTAPFDYKTLAKVFLPEGVLEFFDVTNVFRENLDIDAPALERSRIHIFFDERNNRSEVWHDLKPNDFTEERLIRDRKIILHVRRRRWLTEDGHSKILEIFDLRENKTSYSQEFTACLKKYLDSYPVTARSLEPYF